MPKSTTAQKVCAVIGASHAGVNFAFALRNEGWEGEIILYDVDPFLPYHRPPLSKTFLCSEDGLEKYALKSAVSYQKEGIELRLGILITAIDPREQRITLNNGQVQSYDRLVLATGARPLLPPISGIERSARIFTLRTGSDGYRIREALSGDARKQVVIIGGGYIGLETAASLRKLGADVTVLEREDRILTRVTAPEISQFFQELHTGNGVVIYPRKNVVAVRTEPEKDMVVCSDGALFPADIIIVGVGVRVNLELARTAGLKTDQGIVVDGASRTSDPHIYAIGDCTYHYNPHYDRYIRLECVQNAVDQAKIAAAAVCGHDVRYDALPWFWSNQYDAKLQMVGLSEGYDDTIITRETDDPQKFSIWYFKEDQLLAVDAVNHAKAYVVGTKLIKARKKVSKQQLLSPDLEWKQLLA